MLGSIKSITEDFIEVALNIDLSNQANLMNIHVVFEEGPKKIIGEIISTNKEQMKVSVVGEIKDNTFFPGSLKKPSYKSSIRIVGMQELVLILGEQQIKDNHHFRLGLSSVYQNYPINVNSNKLLTGHFAIFGSTGSGKSCAIARIIQNIFSSPQFVPTKANMLLFDAYGEYTRAFANINQISPNLNYKVLTSLSNDASSELLRIPVWLLDVDDLAILLGVNNPAQIPILEKTLKLVTIIMKDNVNNIAHKNDIIARALLDILLSGKDPVKLHDQLLAVLAKFNTSELNLESQIVQPGYTRTLKQCLFIDKTGKIQDIELVVDFVKSFIKDDLELKNPDGSIMYTLEDLDLAMEFALISEGVLKSDKVFDYANVLSVRLHTLANSSAKEYFSYPNMISADDYIKMLFTNNLGQKAQIVNVNLSSIDDRLAKSITKILSKLCFITSTRQQQRGASAYHILIEEAHRYVQKDTDVEILGYNIFERITKEGRKYGVILGLITQRPSELSSTVVSQCSNFIILKTIHPTDLEYLERMIPNASSQVIAQFKTLQPGSSICFGNAFSVPTNLQFELPNPQPLSENIKIDQIWY